MSTASKKKKVVVTTKSKTKLKPTSSKKSKGTQKQEYRPVYGMKNFKLVLIGLGLIILGMFLMSGGSMPAPDVWDESLIYSHRRITLAPLVILAGLVVEIFAIFR